MRLQRAWSLFLVVGLLLAGCSPAADQPKTLTVFAASSLTEAFTQLGEQFETDHANVSVVFNFAASNALAEQINQGAPADVFASANTKQMDAAIASGRIAAGSTQIFARNRLVVIFPADNPGGVTVLADLAKPGLKLVLAAAEAPVGQYALDFLAKAVQDPGFGPSYKDDVLANVVSYEENVRSVFTKVALGEADAGIVYASDIVGGGAAGVGRLDIPNALNTLATYPLAPLSDSEQTELAQAFVTLVLSPDGQAVMEAYGFMAGQ